MWYTGELFIKMKHIVADLMLISIEGTIDDQETERLLLFYWLIIIAINYCCCCTMKTAI